MKDKVLSFRIRNFNNADYLTEVGIAAIHTYYNELRQLLLEVGWYLCAAEADLHSLEEMNDSMRHIQRIVKRYEQQKCKEIDTMLNNPLLLY